MSEVREETDKKQKVKRREGWEKGSMESTRIRKI